MSDQTPDMAGNVGTEEGSDPSMEDILASIRRIIADDDSGLAVDVDMGGDALLAETSVKEPAMPPASDPVDDPLNDILFADSGSDDDLLIPPSPSESSAQVPDLIDLDASGADILSGDVLLSALDAEIDPGESDDIGEMLLSEIEIPEPQAQQPVTDNIIDLTADLDTVLVPDVSEDEDGLSDIAAFLDDVIEEKTPAPAVTPEAVGGESDIDLVKSLMADLTDDPEEGVEDDLLQSLLDDVSDDAEDEPAAVIAEVATDITDMADDDLLDIMFEDDQGDDEDDLAAEIAAVPDDETVEELDASINALLAIAAAAEADAESVTSELSNRDNDPLMTDEIDIVAPELAVDDLLEQGSDELDPVAVVSEPDTAAADDFDALEALFAEDDSEPDAPVIAETAPAVPETVQKVSISQEDEDILAGLLGDLDAEPVVADAPVVDDLDLATAEARVVDVPETPEVSDEPSLDSILETAIAETPEISNPDPDPVHQEESPAMKHGAVNDSILNQVTESATVEAFASLNQIVDEKTEYELSGPRIGDLVQDALRPMLKEWLDENLQGIVERAVQKEIKRISSGK